MPGEALGRRNRYRNFIALKPGVYSPQDTTLDGFDEEFSGSLVLGEYTSENFIFVEKIVVILNVRNTG